MTRKASYVLLGSLLTVLLLGGLYGQYEAQWQARTIPKSASADSAHSSSASGLEGKLLAGMGEEKRERNEPKPAHPDKFYEYHRRVRTETPDGQTRKYASNYRVEALRQTALRARAVGVQASRQGGADASIEWTERGPANVGGRTRGLVVDPDDPDRDTWFAGSVGGGVWKTTDAGQSWTNLTPDLGNLATVSLAQGHSNTNVLYAGTGEGFFNVDAVQGNGIWKTTDKGQTWEQLAANNDNFQAVNRLIVDPQDAGVVVAATNSGLFRSTSGGQRWTRVYEPSLCRNGDPCRVQQVVAEPGNFQVQYATVNGRGVLRSTNGGQDWSPVFSDFKGQRLELAIAPSAPTWVYVAVQNFPNSDLYLSRDRGENWDAVIEESGSAPNWLGGQGWYDNAIGVHPYARDTVYVGGINLWRVAVTYGSTVEITNVDRSTTKSFMAFNDLGGAVVSGIIKGDALHGQSGLSATDYTDVELRFGAGRSQKAHRFIGADDFAGYAYADYVNVPFEVWDPENNRQLMVSFRDSDENGQFNLQSGGQREYLFVHAMSYDEQENTSIAQEGGATVKNAVLLWPTLAGGATWDPNNLPTSALNIEITRRTSNLRTTTRISNRMGEPASIVHVDHHNITPIPMNESQGTFRLLNANDGGVAYSDDGGLSWTETDNGYNTSQFYGVAKRPGAEQYFGGMQDNGTWLSQTSPTAETEWMSQLGADGFSSVWHRTDPQKLVGSIQFNNIRRSLNGGESWEPAVRGLGDLGNRGGGPFITEVASAPSDPDLVFTTGASGVWRSLDFAGRWRQANFTDGGQHWYTQINHIPATVSMADPQVVWAGAAMLSNTSGAFASIYASTDGGVTFAPTSNFPDHNALVTGLATHPSDPATAYATFGLADAPKILRTTDLGQSWENITGTFSGGAATSDRGFPNVATYDVQVMPFDTDVIWAGTEIGLFVSEDGGQSWQRETSIPAVSIWELKIRDQQVVMATHGRGVWTATLSELASYAPPEAVRAPRLEEFVGVSPLGVVSLRVALRDNYDSTKVLVDGAPVGRLGATTASTDTLLAGSISLTEQREITVAAVSYRDGQAYTTMKANASAAPATPVQETYEASFAGNQGDDFYGDFAVRSVSNFDDPAVHSGHPYENVQNATYTLRVPIRVASSDAMLRYEDVAIVEAGESGTSFGDAEFWDYVVVEGSKDGLHWQPLADGYDARADARWHNVYQNGQEGREDLFVQQSIDLLDTFAPGDTVFVRFRLYADAYTNGWGWAIDNIEIQGDGVVDTETPDSRPETFALTGNYPNPFSEATTIGFEMPRAAQVTIEVYDLQGRHVTTLADRRYTAGYHEVRWQPKRVGSGTYFYRLNAGSVQRAKSLTLVR